MLPSYWYEIAYIPRRLVTVVAEVHIESLGACDNVRFEGLRESILLVKAA